MLNYEVVIQVINSTAIYTHIKLWSSDPSDKQYSYTHVKLWSSDPRDKQYSYTHVKLWSSDPSDKQYSYTNVKLWSSDPSDKQYSYTHVKLQRVVLLEVQLLGDWLEPSFLSLFLIGMNRMGRSS